MAYLRRLSTVGSAVSTNEMPINVGGLARRVTVQQIADLLVGGSTRDIVFANAADSTGFLSKLSWTGSDSSTVAPSIRAYRTAVSNAPAGLTFWTRDTNANQQQRLTLLPDGNFGTSTNPQSQLHVEGASGWIIGDEQDTDPSTTALDANDSFAIYTKNNKLVIAYNNAGTMTYVTIALDGSATTWTHGTTAP